jgi:hypothetical protein
VSPISWPRYQPMIDSLTLGETDFPLLFGDRASVERARQQFLEASAIYEPELLQSLRAGPYSTAQKLGDVEYLSSPGNPEALKLVESTKNWAARWNLDTSWCSSTAHYTVCAWLKGDDKRDFKRRAFPWLRSGITIQMTPTPRAFSFEAAWFDWAVGSGAFLRQAEARFKKEIRTFIKKTIALRKEQGLTPPVKKREEEHFYWLAQYQIGRMSFAEIRRRITNDRVQPKPGHKHYDGSKNLTPEAIQMGVTRLAKLIDLKLRIK